MKGLFVGAFVFLVLSSCLAQTRTEIQPVQDSGTVLKIPPSTPQRVFRVDPLPLIDNQPVDIKAHVNLRVLPDVGCYTMRTYLFSRGPVGSEPRLTGHTTCVPSDKSQVRQARPVLKFVPQ